MQLSCYIHKIHTCLTLHVNNYTSVQLNWEQKIVPLLQAFSVTGLMLWNTLPAESQQAFSLLTFRRLPPKTFKCHLSALKSPGIEMCLCGGCFSRTLVSCGCFPSPLLILLSCGVTRPIYRPALGRRSTASDCAVLCFCHQDFLLLHFVPKLQRSNY